MASPIVKRYLIAFDQHKWKGVAACILIMGGAGFVALQPAPPKQYEAQGLLSYTQPPVIISKTGSDIQQQAQGINVDALANDDVKATAAKQANANPKLVRKNVRVRPPRPAAKGQPPPPPIVTVSYTDEDGKKAADVVNSIMVGMVERSRLINTSRLRAIKEELTKRLPQVEQELRLAEGKLQKFTKVEGPILLAAENGSLIQGITGSQNQQRQIQFELQGIEAQIRSLQQRLGLTPDQAYASSALSADPIIANLRVQIYQIESQLAILSKDLRPVHPNIIALRKQQKAYEEQLRARAAEVIGGNGIAAPLQSGAKIRQDSSLDPARQALAQQLVTLKTQQEALVQQFQAILLQEQKLRREYATIPDKQLELSQLQQEYQLRQSLFSKMQAALVDAQAAEAETVSSLTAVKPAEVSEVVQPGQNPMMTIAIGALAGLAVGGGLIFLLGSMGGILQTMEDIRGLLTQQEVQLLGIVPYILVFDPDREGIPVLVTPDSPYLEVYERIRSSLRRTSDKPVKVLTLSSTIDQEGKSVTAYNLAIASARAGKRTLLIEADLRSPSLSKAVKVAPDPDAFIEPLRYYGTWSECVRLVPEVENLYLVPSPGPLRQPAAIIESSEFRRLIEDMRGRFDLVIIDTPALSICNDALLLEPLTDGMVLVARPGYTGESMLTEAIEQLGESEDLQLLGAIVNGADIPLPMPSVSIEPQDSLTAEAENLQSRQTKDSKKVKAKK
ncbi:polysaccharide biosynthesis tyrosine autokinase [Planktothrix sp. FACHB-1355]|uniref:Polysaccharide biosynthesis tyrosine autokinase n=1 Tax=Aerosakkonema funiforme FACHB-1375 TaxID=2949571 RepID=A0A926ZMC1_9CYAN|nr:MULTISPECIES: tyrosine-protein kinase domain-containing protein [Oscillatoriales]MBD2185946.1 polysaccharide biosynthesis tyrosine autokinase [Aerosakkonema funiforme FACHB-1375]MBD3558559.1 polysaccharide biosynthesis tyrosine autokinase [Planktothrix sp. FACHB-1355]